MQNFLVTNFIVFLLCICNLNGMSYRAARAGTAVISRFIRQEQIVGLKSQGSMSSARYFCLKNRFEKSGCEKSDLIKIAQDYNSSYQIDDLKDYYVTENKPLTVAFNKYNEILDSKKFSASDTVHIKDMMRKIKDEQEFLGEQNLEAQEYIAARLNKHGEKIAYNIYFVGAKVLFGLALLAGAISVK